MNQLKCRQFAVRTSDLLKMLIAMHHRIYWAQLFQQPDTENRSRIGSVTSQVNFPRGALLQGTF